MFRLPLGERVDPAEEKRKVRENTIQNFLVFGFLVAAIRISPYLLDQVKL